MSAPVWTLVILVGIAIWRLERLAHRFEWFVTHRMLKDGLDAYRERDDSQND